MRLACLPASLGLLVRVSAGSIEILLFDLGGVLLEIDFSRVMRRWAELGLTPGRVIAMKHFEPLDGIFELQVGETVVRMGREGLAGLRGELANPDGPMD